MASNLHTAGYKGIFGPKWAEISLPYQFIFDPLWCPFLQVIWIRSLKKPAVTGTPLCLYLIAYNVP